MQSRGHCLVAPMLSRKVIFRILPVGDLTMSMFSPLLLQEVCCFGVIYVKGQSRVELGFGVPQKHPTDILNPRTGQQLVMWAAYEQIAELTGIINSFSSSPIPYDRGFCASLSKADPTAPLTSAGIYCS